MQDQILSLEHWLFCIVMFYIEVYSSEVENTCNYTGKYAGTAYNVALKK